MSDMQRYPFDLAANAAITLPVQGTRCIVKQSRGTVEVRAVLDGGGVVRLSGLQDGQGFSGKQFKSLLITDTSGLANDGYIIVSDESFIDNRISGDVSVIDGEKARTLAGGRFMGVSWGGAVPATYPLAQLWNPSTDKNLIVTAIRTSMTGAASMVVFGSTTALTTSYSWAMGNAKIGDAVGVAVPRGDNLAAEPTYPHILSIFLAPANTPIDVPLSGPVVVPPGKGLTVIGRSLGSYMPATFQWFEEAV